MGFYNDYLTPAAKKAIREDILHRFDEPAVQETYAEKCAREYKANNQVLNETVDYTRETIQNKALREQNIAEYNEEFKKALIFECFYNLYKMSKDYADCEYDDSVAETYIHNYINQEGSRKLLKHMHSGSVMLSEMAMLIEDTCEYCYDGENDTDKDDEDKVDLKKFEMSTAKKDKFFEDLGNVADAEDVSQSIVLRVSNAMSEFIADNNAKKEQINNALEDVKNKVTADTPEDVKESFQLVATQQINRIYETSYTNLFGKLVEELCSSIYKNDELRRTFCTENKLNMGKVIAHTKTLYTVLEMFNTAKIETFNECSIKELVESYHM